MSAQLYEALTSVSNGCNEILDVGAGTRRLQAHLQPGAVVTSLDAFAGDLHGSAPVRGPIILGRIEKWLPKFSDKQFDLALACDILEHFTDEVAVEVVIPHLKRVARCVAMFVPEGEYLQPGTLENPLQAHLSTWSVSDLESYGFTVSLWPGFHVHPQSGKPAGAMWAVWRG